MTNQAKSSNYYPTRDTLREDSNKTKFTTGHHTGDHSVDTAKTNLISIFILVGCMISATFLVPQKVLADCPHLPGTFAKCGSEIGTCEAGGEYSVVFSSAVTETATQHKWWCGFSDGCNAVTLSCAVDKEIPNSCSATTRTWTYGNDTCSTHLPATDSGGSRNVNDTSWRDTGSATFSCQDGTWSNPTNYSCYDGCVASTKSWLSLIHI